MFELEEPVERSFPRGGRTALVDEDLDRRAVEAGSESAGRTFGGKEDQATAGMLADQVIQQAVPDEGQLLEGIR
jgi:hypothetical protein